MTKLTAAASGATILWLPALTPALLAVPSVFAHQFDCAQRIGIDRARCERHEKMFAKCGPIKGEAHFICDREFLLANPLDCKALAGEDGQQCRREVEAFAHCEPNAGREFMRCVRDRAKASPMGH